MGTKLPKVLDECLARTSNSRTIETCLAEHPQLRQQLEPLLYTALRLSSTPKVSPSDEFREISKISLMVRLRERPLPSIATPSCPVTLYDRLTTAAKIALSGIIGARKVAVPVTLALLLAVGSSLFLPKLFSSSPALGSQCTLTLLSGSVMVQVPGSNIWEEATDGITLETGSRVKTAADSSTLVTFLDGSTVKLEPDTDVTIQQAESNDGQPSRVILKQYLGKTWSRVVKMVDGGSHYEIQTPSASAVVRGTLFVAEVDQTGMTAVKTTEGLVSVAAQDQEVYVPAGQETRVDFGIPPSQPIPMPAPESELIITINMPAVGSVCDPTGSSTGYLPSGFMFNQISGSQSSSPTTSTQVIAIPQPMAGEYVVVLRCLADETIHFNIQGKFKGNTVFEQDGTHESKKGNEWVIHVNLHVEDGQFTGASVSDIQPLTGGAPEKIVVPSGQGGQNQEREQGQGKNQGSGQGSTIDQDKDKEQSKEQNTGQGKEKDTEQAKVQSAEQSHVKVNEQDKNQGTSLDKDINQDSANLQDKAPGQSGDTPGQTGDTPGQTGDTPGQTGDTPGQTGDTPGQSSNAPGQSNDTPGHTGDTPGQSSDAPGQSGDTPGQSGDTPGQSGDTPGQSGDTPGQSGDTPGQNDALGQNDDAPGQGGGQGHGDDGGEGQGGGQGKGNG